MCMYKQCVPLTMSPTCACNCYNNSYSKTSGLYTGISAKELLEVIYKLLCSTAMYLYINFGAGNNQTIP